MSLKTKQNIVLALSVFLVFIVPIIIIVLRFGIIQLITSSTAQGRAGTLFLVVTALILFAMMKRIKAHLSKMPFSLFKCLVYGFIKALPFIILGAFVFQIEHYMDDLQFIWGWYAPGYFLSVFLLEPLYQHYELLITDKKQIDLVREAMSPKKGV